MKVTAFKDKEGTGEWLVLVVALTAMFLGAFYFGRWWTTRLVGAVHYELRVVEGSEKYRLQNTMAAADINKEAGAVLFEVVLEDGIMPPAGSRLDAWLFDAESGYYLKAGEITRVRNEKRFTRRIKFGYNLKDFDKAVVTVGFDDKNAPGTVIMEGDIR